MTQKESKDNHHGNKQIALPGHEGKDATLLLRRKNTSQIFVHDLGEAESVYQQRKDNPRASKKGAINLRGLPQPGNCHKHEHTAHAQPKTPCKKEQNSLGHGRFIFFDVDHNVVKGISFMRINQAAEEMSCVK